MEETDQKSIETNTDIPKVPIKTYRWEDVRRSRQRGAYPWTHLTKPPFDEDADPEEYTMEAFRRSRSTSTLGKSDRSDTQEISEIEEIEIKEEEEEAESEAGNMEKNKERASLTPSVTEPSTSKEDSNVVRLEPPSSTLTPHNGNNKGARARSEEPKKKRKLSIESSHSRISLSRLGLMDKLKGARSKLKVPRVLKRSTSDTSEIKEPTKKQKLTTSKKETAKDKRSHQVKDEVPVYIHIPLKPPPGETDEFSSLEFESPTTQSRSGSLNRLQEIGQNQRKLSVLELLAELQKLHEQQVLASETRRSSQTGGGEKERNIAKKLKKLRSKHDEKLKTDTQGTKQKSKAGKLTKSKPQFQESIDSMSSRYSKTELEDSFDSVSSQGPKIELAESMRSTASSKPRLEPSKVQRKESDRLVIEELTDDDRKSNKSADGTKPIVNEPEDNLTDDNVSQYLDKEENKCEIVSQKSSNVSNENVNNEAGPSKASPSPKLGKPDPEKVEKLKSAMSMWQKETPASTPKEKLTEEAQRQVRAKSEEPKRKRKSSIDSSYSRKSLSKLAFMKKLKEAKDKIKLPKFSSFSKADKKETKKPIVKKSEEATESTKKKSKVSESKKQPENPVYIHIPLKLPPGETDEFSYLANETEQQQPYSTEPIQTEIEKQEKEEKVIAEEEEPSTPETPPMDVQLIILTPPSDDEILDVPETPSERHQKYFETLKIEDLKSLAKRAVDSVCPEPKRLETVTEDESEKSTSSEENKASVENQQQQILVDEEDGLKLGDAEIKKEPIEKEKSDSPKLKKKVSFKRKSKTEDGETIYEDVQLSKMEGKRDPNVKLDTPEDTQSMSVVEEKSYLDKKVIKAASLEEDYNKWSKSNDHEYEPVNPPPEEMTIRSPPVVRITDAEAEGSNENRFFDEKHDLDSQEAEKRIDDRFFTRTPDTLSSRTDGELNTSQVDSSALETLPLKKENRKAVDPNAVPKKSFNQNLRSHADKIKTKLQGIKKPNITLPQRPKFCCSAKFKKPNFKKSSATTTPKKTLPEEKSSTTPSSFSLTRSKDNAKDSWKERQHSTESNAGDSKKKLFDFRTYPRIFDRSKKNKEKDRDPTPPPPEFATVPRTNRKKTSIGSRLTDKFKEIKFKNENARKSKEFDDTVATAAIDNADVVRIPLHPEEEDAMDVPSHTRYNEDIDIDDEFHRENREPPFSPDYLKRWDHGEFHEEPHLTKHNQYRITDLDAEDTQTPPEGSFDMGSYNPKEVHSSGSLSEHRRGVLEEIDSDEFFLREKGISQENIEVGKYLSSEIREAFRNPINALSQLQSEDREYDLDLSDQSEPLPDAPKRKPLRKPKRKKTPHVSKEQISFESVTTEPEEYPKKLSEFKTFTPPARPKRKSKKGKKKKPTQPEEFVPFQETIPIVTQTVGIVEKSEISSDNILSPDKQEFYEKGQPQMYENEHMKGIEQPEIKISDPYYKYENFQGDVGKIMEENVPEKTPTAPARRHRSLKSLDVSEVDSIKCEMFLNDAPGQEIETQKNDQEYMIPTPEPPPARPKRMRSRTLSHSGTSQQEDDRTSRGADSLISDNQVEVEEPPCIQDVRDYMGYAIIDKNKVREPPLPPSRFPTTPPRTRRSKRKAEDKFSTVPRHATDAPPVRPLRNYSTLGAPSRTSRSKSSPSSFEDEKENVDISQYIEIEDDESVRHLQSGEVIQKMKDRPLPAPPRPPRRPRAPTREVFRDISHERNLPTSQTDKEIQDVEHFTQTRTMSPTKLSEIEQQILPEEIEETVTHGALVIQPIDDAQILPYSQLHKEQPRQSEHAHTERIIPINREYSSPEKDHDNYDDDEISEIPEEFLKLKSPQSGKENQQVISQLDNQEVGTLTAQKLQVSDLDVDKLRVNELQANKIIVSELDGVNLQVSEINSKSGNLVVSGIELPPNVIQDMLDRLQSSPQVINQSGTSIPYIEEPIDVETQTQQQPIKAIKTFEVTQSEDSDQKKTLTDCYNDEEGPPVPPRHDSQTNLLEETLADKLLEQTFEPPTRPPRKGLQSERITDESEPLEYSDLEKKPRESSDAMPQAEEESLSQPSHSLSQDPNYIPSQPPLSFYALRSPPYGDFIEEDIPLPPRRKRHHKAPPVSRSSSEETPPTQRRPHRSSEPSIPQLTGQLVRACATEADRSLKRLISHITDNVFRNMDGKQDMHIMILILLVLIAGLILLSGDQKVTIHHHWEFFNPPKDL